MVRTYQNVMDARRYESLHDRDYALPRAGEIFGLFVRAAKNDLGGKAVVFVEIDEGLMIWIVRKQSRAHGKPAWRGWKRVPELNTQRLTVS